MKNKKPDKLFDWIKKRQEQGFVSPQRAKLKLRSSHSSRVVPSQSKKGKK